jgi:MATE family multidrug resistance protein
VKKVLTHTRSIFSEVKQSLRLSLPLIVSQSTYALSGFLIITMIAHLGRDALAALALVDALWVFIVASILSILGSISVLVSQSLGAKDHEGIHSATSQGFLLGIILGLFIMFMLGAAPAILKQFGHQSDQMTQLTTSCLHALMWCAIPLSFLIVFEQFLIGIHQTKLIWYISFIQVPFEITACYAFTFGKLGFPKCGIAGYGYGLTLVFACAAIIIGLFLYRAKIFRHYQIFSNFGRLRTKYFLELIRIGWPMGSLEAIELSAIMIITFLMSLFGEDALAAHQIARQYFVSALVMLWGLTQATTVRIGYGVGSNNRPAIKKALSTDIGIGLSLMSIVAIVYLIFAKNLIGIDIDIHNPKYAELVHYAISFLMIMIALQFIESIRFIILGALRGLKDTKIPMLISFIGSWIIALPFAYLFGVIWHLKGTGLWLGLTLGMAINALILLIRFRKVVNKVDLQKLVI